MATMLTIDSLVLDILIADCDRRRPQEACGLLIGRREAGTLRVTRCLPVDNVWPEDRERTSRYAIDPLVQLRAEQDAAASGSELVGMYHSHPHGPAVPSQFDADRAWPGYIYLIVGFDPPAGPSARAWALDNAGTFAEHLFLSEKSI